MTLSQVLEHAGNASDQDLFPVVSVEGGLVGLVTSATMRVASAQLEDSPWAIAADLIQAPVFVQPSDDLRTAGERMVLSGLRELPIVSKEGGVVGLVTESALASLYLQGAKRAEVTGVRRSSVAAAAGRINDGRGASLKDLTARTDAANSGHGRLRPLRQPALPPQTPLPARRLHAQQPIHRLVRQRIDALVTELTRLTGHPLPLDVVRNSRGARGGTTNPSFSTGLPCASSLCASSQLSIVRRN